MEPRSYEENRAWSDYGYHRGETRLKNLPIVWVIESTNHCNIKCVMCPRGEPDIMTRSLGNMSEELFDRVIQESTFFGEVCWLHWFGEPLMNPDLFRQIAIAKRKIPNLGISTNATLLNEENSGRLLDSELDTILISIDGASKEVYENVRKSETFGFERVRANAELFLEMKRRLGRAKPHVTVSIILMEETNPELEAFQRHWIRHGADKVQLKPYVNWGGQDPIFTELALPSHRSALKSPRKFPCKHLWQSVVIAWDGRVVPCCYDYDSKMVLGDLKTSSMAEIWNGDAYVQLRKAELEGKNFSALCANCSQAPGHSRNPNWPAPIEITNPNTFGSSQISVGM